MRLHSARAPCGAWAMRRELLSQIYTTRVHQLWTIRAK
ncbi:DUF4113 domain-containing protein [Pseudomonas poae]|nr:DUF4113 domain-containing protein [Pseudomonas poae]MBC3198338.1 DUF4113 domain-containing protein [Pseudomonas poae]